jgi:NO-binding membrane sensor protein with MHYT domain
MNPQVISSYDMDYVILSFALAFFGSLMALAAARRMIRSDGRINTFDLMAASLALGGIGVWSMHFLGMTALKMDLRVGYSMPETAISLIAVIAGVFFGLRYVGRDPSSFKRLLLGGLTLGSSVVLMHYLGMYGMRFGGYIDWSGGLVALSIVIAAVAATAALWLAFNTAGLALQIVAAAVMAVAVCAMHYTGMAAADFVCTTADRLAPPRGFGVVISADLPDIVMLLSVGMTVMLFIDFLVHRAIANQKTEDNVRKAADMARASALQR